MNVAPILRPLKHAAAWWWRRDRSSATPGIRTNPLPKMESLAASLVAQSAMDAVLAKTSFRAASSSARPTPAQHVSAALTSRLCSAAVMAAACQSRPDVVAAQAVAADVFRAAARAAVRDALGVPDIAAALPLPDAASTVPGLSAPPRRLSVTASCVHLARRVRFRPMRSNRQRSTAARRKSTASIFEGVIDPDAVALAARLAEATRRRAAADVAAATYATALAGALRAPSRRAAARAVARNVYADAVVDATVAAAKKEAAKTKAAHTVARRVVDDAIVGATAAVAKAGAAAAAVAADVYSTAEASVKDAALQREAAVQRDTAASERKEAEARDEAEQQALLRRESKELKRAAAPASPTTTTRRGSKLEVRGAPREDMPGYPRRLSSTQEPEFVRVKLRKGAPPQKKDDEDKPAEAPATGGVRALINRWSTMFK